MKAKTSTASSSHVERDDEPRGVGQHPEQVPRHGTVGLILRSGSNLIFGSRLPLPCTGRRSGISRFFNALQSGQPIWGSAKDKVQHFLHGDVLAGIRNALERCNVHAAGRVCSRSAEDGPCDASSLAWGQHPQMVLYLNVEVFFKVPFWLILLTLTLNFGMLGYHFKSGNKATCLNWIMA